QEWEKAARGTDGRIWPWGNDWDARRANTDDGGPGALTPIGSYPAGASPYGVQDMCGTVNEWCGHAPDAIQQRSSPWGDVDRANTGYLSGGSWNDSPAVARPAHRSQLFIGQTSDDIGMRLAKDA
nr:SUMF1/EgtB/PvdO family nonheme iron enzyme [Ktedonobacterales bacterium]